MPRPRRRLNFAGSGPHASVASAGGDESGIGGGDRSGAELHLAQIRTGYSGSGRRDIMDNLSGDGSPLNRVVLDAAGVFAVGGHAAALAERAEHCRHCSRCSCVSGGACGPDAAFMVNTTVVRRRGELGIAADRKHRAGKIAPAAADQQLDRVHRALLASDSMILASPRTKTSSPTTAV